MVTGYKGWYNMGSLRDCMIEEESFYMHPWPDPGGGGVSGGHKIPPHAAQQM